MADEISPERKAFDYAQSLGVDSVYEHAKERHQHLITLQDRLVKARQKKRELEAFRVDREMDLAEREAGKHPEMSATAMKEHMKIVYHKDGGLQVCRRDILDSQPVIDQLEFEIEQIQVDIKIDCNRLYELGGYLNYLTQISQAREAKRSQAKPEKPEKPEDPEDPWR